MLLELTDFFHFALRARGAEAGGSTFAAEDQVGKIGSHLRLVQRCLGQRQSGVGMDHVGPADRSLLAISACLQPVSIWRYSPADRTAVA
jgi:hypothetical protein